MTGEYCLGERFLAHVVATALNGESLGNYFWFHSVLLILGLPNVSKKIIMAQNQVNFPHNTNVTGECCLEERCVCSRSSYRVKQGIPWIFF